MNRNLAIIGANSLLANAFASRANSLGYQLTGIFNENNDRVDRQLYKLLTNEIDFLDANEFSGVVFFASHLPYSKMNLPSSRFNDVNELLLNCVSNFPTSRFVFCSSVAVYGEPNELPINEQTAFNSPTAYGLAKIAGESIVSNANNGISLRISSIYGTGASANSLIAKWCIEACRKKKIKVFGKGNRLQDYIHIEDVVSCIICGLESKSRGSFVCASGKSISNSALAKLIADAVKECEIQYVGEDNSASLSYDISKTKEKLGWIPQASLKDAIREICKCL